MSREAKVGLTLLTALGMVYLMVTWVKRIQLFAPEEISYILEFENVNGLLEGDPVTVRGYPSGRVEEIRPGSDRVLVRFALEEKIQLRTDARAEIQVRELMGGKQVAILPGRKGEILSPGATLYGTTSLDFSSSFSRFGEVFESVTPDRWEELTQRIDSVGRVWESAIDPGLVGDILLNIERLTSRLDQEMSKLHLDQTYQKIDHILNRAEQSLDQVDQLVLSVQDESLKDAGRILLTADSTMRAARVFLAESQVLMDQFQHNESLAGRLLNDPDLPKRVDSTLHHLDEALRQIHEQRVIVGFKRK